MINDFEMLMPLKNRIERNGLKNEFFKQRFEQTNQFDKKQKTRGCLCWKRPEFEYLEQHFYLRKKILYKIQIDKEIVMRSKQNTGYCIMVHDSAKITNEILTHFKTVKNVLKDHPIAHTLKLQNWVVKLAPLHSNIVWPNFFAGSFISTLKAYLLNLLVFVLALTFVTPVYFM